jgi:hypothetical protein
MFEVSLGASGVNYSVERAEELFEQHRQEIFRSTDRLFARLMFFQWLGVILMALFVSPRTWAGQSSQIHIHVWAAIFLGGAISIFPIWMTRVWPGAAVTRHSVAIAQTLISALLIGLTGGRIETHFHVFGSLVILSFYRDWRVLIPATLLVAIDHFVRGIYWPYSVYGVLAASPLRSLEHAAWVIFEDIFLVISCLRSIREMRSIANRTAALEASEQGFRQIFEEAPIHQSFSRSRKTVGSAKYAQSFEISFESSFTGRKNLALILELLDVCFLAWSLRNERINRE